MRKWNCILLTAALGLSALADTVELKDGRKLTGKVTLYDGQELKLADGKSVPAAEIATIRLGDAPIAAPVAGASIPAGTVVAIRTIDPIDSQKSQPGQSFRASLDEELIVNGAVAAPKGSDVSLKLLEAKNAGKLKGAAQLTISLASIKIGDQMVNVNSEELTSSAAGKGKGSAKRIGIGSAVGATLGGILGGGTGAAIGGAAGAGAGTAVALATKGPRVTIPSETRLSFTIQ